MAFWLSARLALAIAPVLLGVLALTGASARRRRSAAAIVFSTLAVFVGCYLLVPDYAIAIPMRWLPAAAVAWIPNIIVALATVQSGALNWRVT
jgi:peptidoglycan/LPS O-acetylase OafA/YrhL